VKSIAFDFDFTLADTTEAVIGSLKSAFKLAKLQPKMDIREQFSKNKGAQAG
jgi:phosphoglycolate phosphatase-like HAD superfamily hydrolase